MRFIVVPFSIAQLETKLYPGSTDIYLVVDTRNKTVVDWSYHKDIAEEARDTFEKNPDMHLF